MRVMPSGALYLRRFDVDSGGDEIKISDDREFVDAVIDTGRLQTRKGMVATDMDNTMFRDNKSRDVIGDLGVLVFLEKLGDPGFWHFSPEAFKRLLLPNVYRKFADDHSNGRGAHNIERGACQKILKMAEKLVQLYAILKKIVQANMGGIGLDFSHPVVNEFALTMVDFDNAIKVIEEPMVKAGLAPFLMRVRFLAGSDKAKAGILTTTVMRRDADAPDAKLVLKPQSEITNIAADLGLPYSGEEVISPEMKFLRVVEVNEGVRRLISRLSVEMEIPVHVVTANLSEIAATAVRNSVYRDTVKSVYGSLLQMDRNRVGARFVNNTAVNAAAKVDAIRLIQAKSGRKNGMQPKLAAVMGDSPSGDWPMMEHLLKQDSHAGIVVITGADVDVILRKFSDSVRSAIQSGIPNVAERIWTMTYD